MGYVAHIWAIYGHTWPYMGHIWALYGWFWANIWSMHQNKIWICVFVYMDHMLAIKGPFSCRSSISGVKLSFYGLILPSHGLPDPPRTRSDPWNTLFYVIWHYLTSFYVISMAQPCYLRYIDGSTPIFYVILAARISYFALFLAVQILYFTWFYLIVAPLSLI